MIAISLRKLSHETQDYKIYDITYIEDIQVADLRKNNKVDFEKIREISTEILSDDGKGNRIIPFAVWVNIEWERCTDKFLPSIQPYHYWPYALFIYDQ